MIKRDYSRKMLIFILIIQWFLTFYSRQTPNIMNGLHGPLYRQNYRKKIQFMVHYFTFMISMDSIGRSSTLSKDPRKTTNVLGTCSQMYQKLIINFIIKLNKEVNFDFLKENLVILGYSNFLNIIILSSLLGWKGHTDLLMLTILIFRLAENLRKNQRDFNTYHWWWYIYCMSYFYFLQDFKMKFALNSSFANKQKNPKVSMIFTNFKF